MPRQCAAVGCHEKNGLGTPFSFHSFPRDKALRKAWTLKVNRMDVKTKRLWQPKDCDVLCSKHFEPSCFPDKLRLANTFGFKFKADLVPGAIPTIFNHNEASRKRKQEILDQQSASVKRRHKKRVSSSSALLDFTYTWANIAFALKSCTNYMLYLKATSWKSTANTNTSVLFLLVCSTFEVPTRLILNNVFIPF